MELILNRENLTAFEEHLHQEERSPATIAKYMHDIRAFADWQGKTPVSKESLVAWKGELSQRRAPVSVNAALAALHGLFSFLGRPDCRVKYLKIQRRVFRDRGRELSKAEFEHLVNTARRQGQRRLALLLETMGGTGIRVSELPYITVEAAQRGRAEVALKGKIRSVLLPGRLCRKLLRYASAEGIKAGPVFCSRRGQPLSRRQVWAEMKALSRAAGVAESKVFPHNLRHLFARVFYSFCRDLVQLADVLGHSSVDTTRLYLITTGEDFARALDRLGLVG